MGNQDHTPSSTPKPKWEIPDHWAANGKCPACGAQSLKVVHLPNYPDYLTCTRCEISFDVEDGGRNIHVKYLSDQFESTDKSLYNHWVDVSQLGAIIGKRQVPTRDEVVLSIPTQSYTDEEAWSRALGMYRMGNKPRAIQLTLTQTGATPEQAKFVHNRLLKIAEQDAQRQSQKFLIVAGVSVILLVLLAGGLLVSSGRLPIILGLVTVTPAPQVSQSSALDKLLSLVPDAAKPALMDLPDTMVDTRRGPGPSKCPATSADAVRLFGGSEELWTFDSQFAAWQMISAGDSYTVLVPTGMIAGYIDNTTIQMQSIHGPATIYNANFVTIMCE